jgi:hypothetical protein
MARFLSSLACLACVACLAGRAVAAGDVGSVLVPHAHLAEGNHLSLGLRAGPDFLLGRPESAYKPALDLGLVVDLPLGEETGVSLEVDHALHHLDDANPLLDGAGASVDPGAFSGTQRFLSFDLGVRLGMLFIDETRIQPDTVLLLPWVRFGLGLSLTDTILTIPSFEGQEPLRTRKPMVTVDPSLGVAIHLARPFTLQPSCKAVMLAGIDHDEVGNEDALRIAWRVLPSLDLLANF